MHGVRSTIPGFLGAVALAAALVVPAPGLAQSAIERGQAAAAMCVACHQADGNGMNIAGGESWPRLAGLNAAYLQTQLQAFKSGARQNASMKPFADMLDDRQIVDVSLYYASLPAGPVATAGDAEPDLLAHGEKLALHGDWDRYVIPCISCHGPGNQGVGAFFPDIAGQQPGYVAAQLKAWQDGTRSGDPLDLMGTIARRMDDRDIQAVSAWLATQPAAQPDQAATAGEGGAQ